MFEKTHQFILFLRNKFAYLIFSRYLWNWYLQIKIF